MGSLQGSTQEQDQHVRLCQVIVRCSAKRINMHFTSSIRSLHSMRSHTHQQLQQQQQRVAQMLSHVYAQDVPDYELHASTQVQALGDD